MEEHRRLAMAAAFVILLTIWSSPAMAMAAAAATEVHSLGLNCNETERINAVVRRNLGGLPEVYHKKLKIAVPLKHGFRAFVNVTDQGVTGYCIDLFEAAVNKLPYRLIYEFVVFDRSYDELVQSVSSGINDAAVGDITIIADRASHVEFTMPYTESGQIIKSPLSKIVVVIWCFVVLVLVQSYTASFSSILTVKRFQPSVTDLDQLLKNGDYVGYQEGSFVNSFLTRRGFGERRLRSYTKKQEYAEALRKGSKNGGVSAIVDEIPYLTAIVSDPHYQKEFQMLKRIYKTPGFGFVFPPGFPLVHNLSTAMLDVTSGDEGSRMETKWFGAEAVSPSNAIPNTDSAPLTLRSFSGSPCQFLPITPKLEILMCKVLMWVVETMHMKNLIKHRTAWVALWLIYTSMKFRIDSSQDIHGSVERADGEEPRPIQNGPVPTNSTQTV
ncbi:hypothetical protein OsI_21971 [Oryza sativa Indica Group]|uniref:Ionotropic glutamate receptor C-terminal domain-containing protein n=1 Tax=Oryza sativa subsp. indica TaxID=39946 RepID=B8B3M9_ORYSI|nr:hypothetical protein OsI_21971 [Oryza sativa Indica Group]